MRLEPLAVPALVVDADYRVRATNAALRVLTSQPTPRPTAHCFELLHGRNRPCTSTSEPCPLEACRRHRRPVVAVHSHACGEGPRRDTVLLRPILDEDRSVVACLATLHSDAGATHYVPARCETSIAIAPVQRRLQRLAHSDAPLLVCGEPGTGKARVARALHRLRGRRARFEERSGCELAADELKAVLSGGSGGSDRGTLYLADVEGLDAPAQLVLSRATAVGPAPACGWRLIAGTSADLDRAVSQGRFRSDLASRLSRLTLRLPPLRCRRSELPRIATALLQESGGRGRVLAADALARLASYSFPGNLDELVQVLGYANLMAEGAVVRASHLPAWVK